MTASVSTFRRAATAVLLSALLLLLYASGRRMSDAVPDHPRVAADVTLRDVIFRSNALGRDMPYRVYLPTHIAAGQRLPVVYLLHGAGADFHEWSNNSDVSRFASPGLDRLGLILVMPEGNSSYYTNSVGNPRQRYEDYISKDLIEDVEDRFPATSARAVIGVSMGGFGAIKLALDYPSLFAFVGALSPALDPPSRPFSFRRPLQWFNYRSTFGPRNSAILRRNDPFWAVRSASPAHVPHMFITCGDKESLLSPDKAFAEMLAERQFNYEFHVVPGAHDWNQWNAQIPGIFAELPRYLKPDVPPR
jgi:putative tributyrin esterase